MTQVDRFDIQSLFSPRITQIYTNYILIVNFVNSCLLVKFVVSLALSFKAVNLSKLLYFKKHTIINFVCFFYSEFLSVIYHRRVQNIEQTKTHIRIYY